MSEAYWGICGLAVLGCLQGPDAVFKDEGEDESEGEPLGILQEQEQEGCCASCNGNAPKGLHSSGETLLSS